MILKRILFSIAILTAMLLFHGCEKTTPTAAAVPEWETIKEMKIYQSHHYMGFLNETYGITVGYDGETHYTTDGGQNWPQSENVSYCRFGLEILDTLHAWSCGNGGHVRATKDGGVTWQAVADFLDDNQVDAHYLSFADENTGWIASPTHFATTKDGGNSWDEQTLPDGFAEVAALFLRTPENGYLLDTNGKLFITEDGGASWKMQTLNLETLGVDDGKLLNNLIPQAVVQFDDENTGTIVFFDKIQNIGGTWTYHTTDGGATWASEELQLNEAYTDISLFLSRDGKYLTARSGKDVSILKRK